MNDEHMIPKAGPASSKSLEERFARRPRMRRRLQQIADLMDQAIADGCTADEAEEMAMEQMSKLGADLLGDWAKAASDESVRQARKRHPNATKCSKKNSSGTPPSDP